MSLDPDKAQQFLTTLATAPDRDSAREMAERALNFLIRQLEELRGLANGYPRNPISADVWMAGKALAEACDVLTDVFSRWNLQREEELASRLAVGMACQVMGHYPEEIFPRVLRNSKSHEAIGEVDQAIGGYEAIVLDFGALGLEGLLDEEMPLEESSRAILAAVHEACKRLTELTANGRAEVRELKGKLEHRLQEGP